MAKLPNINFTYRKYTTPGPSQEVEIDGAAAYGEQWLQFVGAPGWLRIFNPVRDPVSTAFGRFTVQVNINAAALNNFAPGTYEASVRVDVYQNTGLIYQGSDFIKVSVTVEAGVSLKVSTDNMAFNYVLGGNAPADKLLNITTNNAWQITGAPSWLELSTESGTGNGTVSVGIDTTGLVVQGYTATLTVHDGLFTKTVSVTLNVTAQSTAIKFLNVYPESIEFLEEFTKQSGTIKILTIDASAAWAVDDISQSWLSLSASSGASGVENVEVSVDPVQLPKGNHFGQITFVADDILKKVNVALSIVEKKVSGVSNGKLYYAADRNTIELESAQPNSFIEMEGVATTKESVVIINKEAPFVNGVAKVLLGEEAEGIIEEAVLDKDIKTTVRVPGEPMGLSFNLFEKNKFTGNTLNRGAFSGIKVLKGRTPKHDSRLCYTPGVVHMTNKGIVSLITQEDGEHPRIKISGTKTFNSGIFLNYHSDVYQCIFRLDIFDYKAGDVCNIEFGKQKTTVNIVGNEPEETMLFFDNEWGFFEYFQCRGHLAVKRPRSNIEQTYAEDGQRVTKVVEVQQPIQFEVYTGWVLTYEEQQWLATILSAKRWYLLVNGEFVPVICTTRSLDEYKTRSYYKSYLLTFKSAIT